MSTDYSVRSLVICGACLLMGVICVPAWFLQFGWRGPDLPRSSLDDWYLKLRGKTPAEVTILLGAPPVKFLDREQAEAALEPNKLDDEDYGRYIGAIGRWLTEEEELVLLFDRQIKVMRVSVNPLPRN